MRRADRLLQIIQCLRRASGPRTAQDLAEELEVATRTIYRDIVALQAARVPIDGAAGVGYVLRPGYDLPPLMFGLGEVEAVVLGLAMVAARGDAELVRGAADAMAKIKAVLPAPVAAMTRKAALLVPHQVEEGAGLGPHFPMIRSAIRDGRKLGIRYADARGDISERTIWPLGLYLFSHATLICAWCESRQDYRAFRSDRVQDCATLDARFDGRNGALMAEFLERFSGQQQLH